MKKISLEKYSTLLVPGNRYIFETFKVTKEKKIVSDQFISGTLIAVSTKIAKIKDNTPKFTFMPEPTQYKNELRAENLRFKPDTDKVQWKDTEEYLTLHETVVTTGMFQIWSEEEI
jgi:hypothetical protein